MPQARLHAARLAEQYQPSLGDRCPHDPPSRLSHQHGQAEADRGTLRLDQDCWRSAQDTPLRTGPGRMVLCPDRCRLQSRSHSEDLGGNGMSLSGGLKMKQKHSHYRACSADHGLSIPCCTRKHQHNPPQNKLFQQPARHDAAPLAEVELELKRGKEADLFQVAKTIAHKAPLELVLVSK